MKQNRLLRFIYIAIAVVLSSCQNSSEQISNFKRQNLKTRADLAIEQEVQMTMDMDLGIVPRERLWIAFEDLKKQQTELYGKREKGAISSITWEERGPKNVGGRTRALLFDLNDATNATVWAGSVGGGLWKTTNIYSNSMSWAAANDLFENLAVTTIAQHPTNHDTIFFGTGEGWYNIDAIRGDGIFRSTDGGVNWTQLTKTTSSTFNYVQKIVVSSNGYVFVATRDGGIQRSTDNGENWSQVLGTSSVTSTNRVADIEIAANGDIYAALGIFGADGIYKSVNNGTKWNKKYTSSSSEERIEIACAPSDFKSVYAIVQSASTNGVSKMMKTTDSGANWSSMSSVSWQDQCFGSYSSDFSRGQAWYDLLLSIDPNDKDVVTVGGVDIFRTNNGGSSWNQVSSWTGCTTEFVHADHHTMVYAPGSSDTAIFGNDGGVYVSKDMTSGSRTISNQGTNYNTTQYYACAIHPAKSSNHMLAGSQDNGTQRYLSTGINATVEEIGGDGAFCHINQIHPDTQLGAYTRNNVRISLNGGYSWSTLSGSESVGNFINQSDYDDANSVLYSARNGNQVKRWKNVGGTVSATNMSSTTMGSSQASAIRVCPNNPESVYIGTEGGRVIKITGANGGTPTFTNLTTGTLPTGNVSCIEVENGDSNHLLVTYSNYGSSGNVYRTTNGGTSWTDITGDLPDMPIRWITFSPIANSAALVATELGVWSCDNITAGSVDWGPSNTSFPNVRVDMLQIRKSDSTVIAATHGRGLFSTSSFSTLVEANFSANALQVYVGDSVQFTNSSLGAITNDWDFDNDGIYESSEINPFFVFSDWGTFSVKLRINGKTGDSTTKLNYIQVLPRMGTPYYLEDGGNMEVNAGHFAGTQISGNYQLWERGAPSYYFTTHYNGNNAWVTDLDANCIRPASKYECALLTPSFNMTKSGTYRIGFKKSAESYYSSTPYATVLEYSTDKGDTWTRLGTETTGYSWYNKGPSASYSINSFVRSDGIGWLGTYSKDSTSFDVSSLSGNDDVRFRVLHTVDWGLNSIGYKAGFLVDDFSLIGPTNDSIAGGGIETEITSRTLPLGPDDTTSFFSNNGKLIATIINEDNSHDFGNVKVEIDNSGIGVINFDSNTQAKKKIFRKTIKITPENNSTTADVKISLYFTKAEFSAWKSATGLYGKDVQLFKTTGPISTSTSSDGTSPTKNDVDSTFQGENIRVTSSFTNGFSGIGGGGGGDGFGNPLPVKWLSFDGHRLVKAVILDWSTASELENDRFDIYRKAGARDFVIIKSVKGKGTSNRINSYRIYDEDIAQYKNDKLCYKIEQIDFDGIHSSSRIICLKPGENNAKVAIGPNPASDILAIKIDPWKVRSYRVDVMDINGRIQLSFAVNSGNSSIDISELASGSYFAIIRSEGYILSKNRFLVY